MISDRRRVRLRSALDEWFVVVVVALLGLALLGGWGVYGAVADDGEETEHRTVEAWSTTGGFTHGATVQEENEVFPVGTELEDRSVYFAEITPELEATFHYAYDAPDGDLAVSLEADRVIRSVGETDDETELEYWAVNETIAQDETEGLAPGEEHATSFAVDVPEMAEEAEEIQESLDDSAGDIETVVEVQVAIEGTIDGESVDRVDTYELVLEPDDSTYAVDAPAADERTEERTEAVAVAGSSGGLGAVVSALLGLGSVAALGALATARRKGTLAPSAAELERIESHYEREEFDDWISRGTLPADVREWSRIEIATLEDLVDVAVDCDRRVIEDDPTDAYYVVDGQSLYVYEPAGLDDGEDESEDPVHESDSRNTEEPPIIGDGSGEERGLEDGHDEGDS